MVGHVVVTRRNIEYNPFMLVQQSTFCSLGSLVIDCNGNFGFGTFRSTIGVFLSSVLLRVARGARDLNAGEHGAPSRLHLITGI